MPQKNNKGFIVPHLMLLVLVVMAVVGIGAVAYNKVNPANFSFLGASTGTLEYTASKTNSIGEEDGKAFNLIPVGSTGWLGRGGDANGYLGMRFTGDKLPSGAKIKSAKITFTSPADTWIQLDVEMKGDNAKESEPFSDSRRPSSRLLTKASAKISDNVKWTKGKTYTYDVTDVVKEVMGISPEVNTVTIIAKGTGKEWSRKKIANADKTPKLTITYEVAANTTPTPTITVTPVPTAVPSVTATPTATPTSTPTPTATPTVTVTSVPTTVPTVTPTPTPSPTQVGGVFNPATAVAATSFGIWDPANTLYQGTNNKYPICPKSLHDSYFVIGPDGKKYPTWHPPIATDPATGKTCAFGHEHGRDPSKSLIWKQVKEYFYYDANKNGVMDSAEEAVAGLPFGYANEQMSAYHTARGEMVMRHEDHVGHKVDFANGEGEIATHQENNSTTNGVRVGTTGSNGTLLNFKGIRCYYLAKPHQGVSSPDAFTNNLHEVFYFASCWNENQSLSQHNQKISMAVMMPFDRPGGFTKFMPLCGVERRNSAQDFINLGTNSMNMHWPTGDGNREIITRDCVEKGILVPSGQFSGNLYEAWTAGLSIKRPNGTNIASRINLLFDVEDANRYYDPSKPNNLGYTMDLCYEEIAGGRRARGGACEWATNYNSGPSVPANQRIAWNSPKSGFRGIHRGMYFQPAYIENAGGPEYWYSDPYGKNSSTTPFAGSIKQQVSAKNLDYSAINGGATDPRVTDRIHDDGNGSVYAPN